MRAFSRAMPSMPDMPGNPMSTSDDVRTSEPIAGQRLLHRAVRAGAAKLSVPSISI